MNNDQIKISQQKRLVKTKKTQNAITKDAMSKKLSIAKSIENDIISVNESSQSSQINYSLEKFRIISNNSVKSTKKKTYIQTSNRNEFIDDNEFIFTSDIYAKDFAQSQILNAFEIQSFYISAKFNTFDFISNFLFSQFV